MIVKILCRRYIAGEAWMNRVLAYAKGLSEIGCEVELYFLISDHNRSTYKIDIPQVKVKNLWEQDNFLEKRFRALSYIRNLFRFRNSLGIGDSVFIYGGEYNLIKASLKPGVDVFAEITEHPYVSNKKGKRGEIKIDKKCRRVLKQIKGLAVISHSLKDYFKSIGIDEGRLCVTNMFVEPKRFDIEKDKSIEPYIAYCGIISIKKDGVDTLIKAYGQFCKIHPEYKLYIIGRFGSLKVKDTLDRLIEELGIKDRIIFTGQILPEDMPKLLVNAHILALARPNNLQAQNGFPTKLGEYLSTGNPSVVTDVGEISHFIKDGYNGFLVNPDDYNAFAEKLVYIADNYEKAIEIAKKGKELVEKDFSYKSQSQLLLDFMNNLKFANHFNLQRQ